MVNKVNVLKCVAIVTKLSNLGLEWLKLDTKHNKLGLHCVLSGVNHVKSATIRKKTCWIGFELGATRCKTC